jgi:signal transduction histidine kinase
MFINWHDLTLATILLVFAAGIALALGFFVTSTISDRVVALSKGAQAVAHGDLRVRVDDEGRDEVARLGHTFNEMALRLDGAARKQQELDSLRRELIAWVGHDLRTPLASVRAIVEALADGVVDDATRASLFAHRQRASRAVADRRPL